MMLSYRSNAHAERPPKHAYLDQTLPGVEKARRTTAVTKSKIAIIAPMLSRTQYKANCVPEKMPVNSMQDAYSNKNYPIKNGLFLPLSGD